MNRNYLRTLPFLLLSLSMAGCGGIGAGLIGSQQPRIRLFNAVDGQSSVSAVLKDSGGSVVATTPPAAFGAANVAADAIAKNTNLAPTIVGPNGLTALFTGNSVLYQINDRYTLYAMGTSTNYLTLPLSDQQKNATSGDIGVRMVQAASSVGPVDLYFVSAPQTTVSGATATIYNLAYGSVGGASNATTIDSSGYVLVPATTSKGYNLLLTAHGSTSVLATLSTSFSQGTYYTVVVTDGARGPALTVLSDRH